MVLGIMPGHHDAGNEYTSLEDTKKATRDAMDLGLAGKINVVSRSKYRAFTKTNQLFTLFLAHIK